MSKMKASDLKKGVIINDEGQLYAVIDVEHRTPGNLRAMYQTTLKNILDGRLANRRYSASDYVDKVDLEPKKGQYLFHDHSGFHFMDMETYETIVLDEAIMAGVKDYLKENAEINLLYHGDKPITAELPTSIELKIIESAPGARGDTSGKAMKSAKLETGLVINVPLFIEEGEVIKVDTRNGQYLGRA
jgi:elongation factor P